MRICRPPGNETATLALLRIARNMTGPLMKPASRSSWMVRKYMLWGAQKEIAAATLFNPATALARSEVPREPTSTVVETAHN